MHDVQSPRTDDGAIEREIQAKGKTAPRITPADIEAAIKSTHYFTAGEAITAKGEFAPMATCLLTFCVLVLNNGYTVTGESACASVDNFDEDIGRRIAHANAVNKVWPLLGFQLRQRVHEETETDYRDRVRAELAQLDERIAKLSTFCSSAGGAFYALPTDEQQRLTEQQHLMHRLSAVLRERVAAFD